MVTVRRSPASVLTPSSPQSADVDTVRRRGGNDEELIVRTSR